MSPLGNSNQAGSTKKVTYQEALKMINWSRAYKWYVELEGAPHPFDSSGIGLPVIEVQDPIAFGNTHDIEQSVSWLRVPRDRGRFEITMSMYDDENATIERFFEDWFDSIYDVNNGVEYVTNAMKLLTIYKLTGQNEVIFFRQYYVYPYQPMKGYNKQDDSGPRRYDVTFVVVSQLGRTDSNRTNVQSFIQQKISERTQ